MRCQISQNFVYNLYIIQMAIDKTMVDKLTDSEKKKIKQANKAKANPGKAEAKKEKNDACRQKRKEQGTSKSFS